MSSIAENITAFISQGAATLKSVVKILLLSRRSSVTRGTDRPPLIIMGNGPSLSAVISGQRQVLELNDTLAVNFAANAPEYEQISPANYLLADPHFEAGITSADPNVRRLFSRIDSLTLRPMTLFVPARWDVGKLGLTNPLVRVERYNPVGIDGWDWFCYRMFGIGRGMPSPRNVLIPALMVAIQAGYTDIYLAGADHSWLRTLSVSDDNEVVTIQPHFYKDNESEKERVASVYRDVRLHDILLSFHLAFKSYHRVASYARRRGVRIVNSTPGSFIDAFPRGMLPGLEKN